MAEYAVMPAADYKDACDAVREKTGGTAQIVSGELGEQIRSISGGGGKPVSVPEKDVNFYDYDGTCLYAYTLAEAQALTKLPPGPKHDGLIFQEWNWSLEDVNALDQFMVIGANYITDDGKTRLYISIEYEQHLTVPLHIRQTVSEGVEIDWGDGSPIETISGTGEVNTSHTYAQLGRYVIRLNVTSGELGFGASDYVSVFGKECKTLLRKAELGRGIRASGASAFHSQKRLEIVTFHQGVTGLGSYVFYECYSLSGALVFPEGFDTGGAYFCYGCTSLEILCFPKSQICIENSAVRGCGSLKYTALYRGSESSYGVFNYGFQGNCSLRRFELPDSVSILQGAAFYECTSLTEFTVKANITTINVQALRNCRGLVILRFLPTTPPTVANANAFTGIPASCIVEVPAESLEAYQTATNYGGIAAQMVGV